MGRSQGQQLATFDALELATLCGVKRPVTAADVSSVPDMGHDHDRDRYHGNVVWVDPDIGDDAADGSAAHPVATVHQALASAAAPRTVVLKPGVSSFIMYCTTLERGARAEYLVLRCSRHPHVVRVPLARIREPDCCPRAPPPPSSAVTTHPTLTSAPSGTAPPPGPDRSIFSARTGRCNSVLTTPGPPSRLPQGAARRGCLEARRSRG